MSDEPRNSYWTKFRAAIDLASSIAMLGAATFIVWGASNSPGGVPNRPNLSVPTEPVRLAGAPVLGSSTAPVALLVFSDFECPFCARFTRDVLPLLKERYIASGKVQMVFRHLPLPMHQNARAAAQVAECAGLQNKFWQIHDRLFREPSRLDAPELRRDASEEGLDLVAFDSCFVQDARVARRASR